MKLKKLLKYFPDIQVKGSKELEVSGICADSRRVAPGNLFIARRGASYDGTRYIPEALSAGAVAILTDLYDPYLKEITQLITPGVAALEPLFAAAYYQFPSQELLTVGITGTNGKTTTAFLTRFLLEQLHHSPCGLIGTIEYIVGNRHYQASHTTPEPCNLQKLLREMVQERCRSVVMEVTSHALEQRRCQEVEFDLAIFTNLTQDHLDYHKSMEEYAKAKRKLFTGLIPSSKKQINLPKHAIFNVDDSACSFMRQGCQVPILTYGIDLPADVMASDIRWSGEGTVCKVHYQGQQLPLTLPLAGKFNLYNALAAITALLAIKYPLPQILATLANAPSVPGRLQRIPNSLDLQIYVDFCHTPDSLQKALETLRPLTPGRLIVLFGCGGNRDPLKRPMMGRVCEECADLLVITSDNPRSEDPEAIIQQIMTGLARPSEAIVEVNRKEAIWKALNIAKPGDTILLAGKGHERYQILGSQIIPFDDEEIATQLCKTLALSIST